MSGSVTMDYAIQVEKLTKALNDERAEHSKFVQQAILVAEERALLKGLLTKHGGEADKLKQILGEVQWGTGPFHNCVYIGCGRAKSLGHSPTCVIGMALKGKSKNYEALEELTKTFIKRMTAMNIPLTSEEVYLAEDLGLVEEGKL